MGNRHFQSGSIGIGAMIVFIALILVAAVASTIVISTVEKLNQSAESTSDDVKNQLSTKMEIESLILTQPSCSAELFQDAGFGGAWSTVFTTGDYDNDGFEDLFITGGQSNDKLYRNIGNGKFKDIAYEAGIKKAVSYTHLTLPTNREV